jgi:type II restriction enzyme
MRNLNKLGITQWDYFVNWTKVYENISHYKTELCLLNALIGEQQPEQKLIEIICKYPDVVQVIPILLAVRADKDENKQFSILIDTMQLRYLHFDLSKKSYTAVEAQEIALFFIKTGLGKLVSNKKVTNLVDYVTGVEAGLDSNGRKNRGGHQMESLIEQYVSSFCKENALAYLKEANAQAIKNEWNIDIIVDKSSRRIDFVINQNGKLYFIEVNYYNGGGSKLKSTATEYANMANYWNKQGITFVWITDGNGWYSAHLPLREYFEKADHLLNIDMMRKGALDAILKSNSTN